MRSYSISALCLPAAVLASGIVACAPAAPVPPAVPAPAAGAPTWALTSRAALVDSIDAQLDAAEFRNMHWGVLIVDPERGDTLYSRNAGKLFMPASNQKLITGSTALAQLGADYRYRTAVVATGPVNDGVLDGDLVVHGTGDPTVSDRMRGDAMRPLRDIADSLAARGIRRITGALRPGRDAFSDSPWGFGWSHDDLTYPYSAGVDELMFNEGFARVTVHGERAGERPRVVVRPAGARMRIANGATTVAKADTANRLSIRATDFLLLDAGSETARITGVIAVGDSISEEIAFFDQPRAYLAALGHALAERGIAFDTVSHARTAPERAETLFVQTSPPLREILPAFEKPSQNQIGELLLKTLALEATGTGTALAGRRIVEQQLLAWGADSAGFAVRDGSGLSRHNYVSPETLVKVLDAMRRHPDFRTFHDALPIGGVDGTIRSRMRGTPAQGNVRAKTGTIDKSRALSGYVTTADGRLLLFSMLANNHTVPTRRVDRVQDLIAAWLAGSTITGLTAVR